MQELRVFCSYLSTFHQSIHPCSFDPASVSVPLDQAVLFLVLESDQAPASQAMLKKFFLVGSLI